MALKTTTTPTLTTQVNSVGVISSTESLRFLIARLSLEEALDCLRLSDLEDERRSAEADVEVDVRLIVGWKVGS